MKVVAVSVVLYIICGFIIVFFIETFIQNVIITPDRLLDIIKLGDTVVYNCSSFTNTEVNPSVFNIEWRNQNGEILEKGNQSPLILQIMNYNSSQVGNYSCNSWLGNMTAPLSQDTIRIEYDEGMPCLKLLLSTLVTIHITFFIEIMYSPCSRKCIN